MNTRENRARYGLDPGKLAADLYIPTLIIHKLQI